MFGGASSRTHDVSSMRAALLEDVADLSATVDDGGPSIASRPLPSRRKTRISYSHLDVDLAEVLPTEIRIPAKKGKGIALTPLSFMDEFELINGVPAFVLESGFTEDETSGVRVSGEQPSDATSEQRCFTCHAFSTNGSFLAAGDDLGMIRVWDTDNFNLIRKHRVKNGKRVGCVRFLTGSTRDLVACDILGNCERFCLDDESVFAWTIQSVSEIKERFFVQKDELAIATAMDPDSMSAKLWPPCTSGDGSVTVQAISTRVGHDGFLCDACFFLSRVHDFHVDDIRLTSKGRTLVSRYELSEDGTSLLAVFAPPHSHDVATDDSHKENWLEVWPAVSFEGPDPISLQFPYRMGRWVNGGEYVLGWISGAGGDGRCEIVVWKTSDLVVRTKSRRGKLKEHAKCIMESDDTLFHIEMLAPSRGDKSDDVVLAVCFTESNDACLSINIWSAKQQAVLLQFSTSTAFDKTLVGKRQYLSQPDVMGYYWGHNEMIMEESLIKMCISPCKNWMAFYSSECNQGYLWSLKDAIPVAKLDLPPNLADENAKLVDAMKTIKFSPAGNKVFLIGRNRMIAFVPAFLQSHRGLQMKHIHTAADKYVTFSSLKLSFDGSVLILGGQEKPTNVSPIGKTFGPAFLSITEANEGSHVEAPREDDSSAFMKVPKDYCLSKNGSKVGFIFVDNSVAFAFVQSAMWDPVEQLRRFQDDSHYKILSTSKENIYNRVFFAKVSRDQEQLVCFSLQRKGCVSWFDIERLMCIETIPISVDQSLGIKLTGDEHYAVVLGTQTAQVVNLRSRQIDRTVNYNLSIPRARQVLASGTGDSSQVFFSDADTYEVSRNGSMVLLGWDNKKKRPIYLTPGTRSRKLKRFIQRLGSGINTYTWLSDNSRWVIVASEYAAQSGGLKGLCVHDTRGNRASRQMPDELDTTGCEPLYDISGDGRIIVSRSVFARNENDSTLFDVLLVLTPYAIEGSIPDYERLKQTAKTEQAGIIQKLIQDFSWPLVNHPDFQDKSLFHHALTNGMQEWVDALYDLGMKEKIPLDLCWTEASEESGDAVDTNVLQWAIDARSTELIWSQLTRLVNGATTVDSTASILQSTLANLFMSFPAMFLKLMQSNMLIASYGKAPVAADIFDKRKFLVGSDSNDISWEEKPPSKVYKLWNSVPMGSITLRPDHSHGKKKAEIQGESKFVLVKDIAQVGVRGISRTLLMLKAPTEVFKTEIMEWTITHKWNAYGLKACLSGLFWHSMFAASFVIYALLLGRHGDLDIKQWYSWLILLPLVLACFVGLSDVRSEWMQLRRYEKDALKTFGDRRVGRHYYVHSHWNWIELISYLILFPLPAIHILAILNSECDEMLSALVAVEALLLFFKFLYFAQAFRISGPFVIAIREVILDVSVFVGIAVMILGGFSIAFVVLFRHTPDTSENFGNVARSLLTMFVATLGDFDLDAYRNAKALSGLLTALFVIYMLALMVLMLNLLIGVMSDSFDRVRNQEQAEFLKGRASVIDDYEAGLTDAEIRQHESRIGRYLHALIPLETSQEVEGWSGKITAFEKVVERKVEEGNSQIAEDLKNIKSSIEELKNILASLP